MSINGLEKEYTFAWFSQPGRDERRMVQSVNNEGFYCLADRKFQEQNYLFHLVCASYNDYQPPIFTVRNDGKLGICESRYYYFRSSDRTKSVNPFSDEGIARIKTAAQKGIEADNWSKLEDYHNLYQNCIPELACLLDEITPPETEYDVESA
jgi:hypothetical protein